MPDLDKVVKVTGDSLLIHEFATLFIDLCSVTSRADQNTGGALLKFPMRTPIHGKSRVSTAISVCDN